MEKKRNVMTNLLLIFNYSVLFCVSSSDDNDDDFSLEQDDQ